MAKAHKAKNLSGNDMSNSKQKLQKGGKPLLLAALALIAATLLFSAGKSQAQPNPCWKLVCPHDPANGMFNPDSVYVDTCQTSENYYSTYVKNWIDVILSSGWKQLFPKYNPDTTLFVDYENLDSNFIMYKRTLKFIDSIYGHFTIRKKYPECVDLELFASDLYRICFDNYINIYQFKHTIDSINTYYKYYAQMSLFNYSIPKINGINPLWKMIIKDIGEPYDVNPDSVYWNISQMKHDKVNEDEYYEDQYQLANQWWEFFTYDTIPLLSHKDTILINDIDSTVKTYIYDYYKYIVKERGSLLITQDKNNLLCYRIKYSNYTVTAKPLLPPYNKFIDYTGTRYLAQYKKGEISNIISYPRINNLKIEKETVQNNHLQFSYYQDNESSLTISIYNTLSEKMIDVYSGTIELGEHSYNVDISTFPAGVYFIVISDGKSTQSKKFIRK